MYNDQNIINLCQERNKIAARVKEYKYLITAINEQINVVNACQDTFDEAIEN